MEFASRLFKLKYLYLFVILFCCILANPSFAMEIGLAPRYELAAENQYLQFYLDPATTEFAVVIKESGRVWYSNPENNRTQEQIMVEYFTPLDDTRTMNNRADSVNYDQFEITELEDGVRIDYVLGQVWNDADFLPILISEERFENEILSKIENDSDRNFVRSNYVLFTLEEMPEDYTRASLANVDKNAIFGSYTVMPETNVTGRAKGDFIRHILEQFRNNRDDISSVSQVTFEMISTFIDTPTLVRKPNMFPWDMEDMMAIIRDAGYTPYDKQEDNEFYGLIIPEPKVENFTIPIEYRLEDDSFVVRVPIEDVVYPKDAYTSDVWGMRGVHWSVVEDERLMEAFGGVGGGGTVTFPLHAINLLPYFGSPSTSESGYILIPDGSGALINLTGNRVRQITDLTLQHRIYGQNASNVGIGTAADAEQELRRHFKQQQLPIFGMKHEDAGFLAVIESGDAVASIVVKTSGRVNPVDAVYPRFNVLPYGSVQLAQSSRGGGGAFINTYQQRLVNSDLQVRYMFLEGEEADYSGMARLYQDYLVDRHDLVRVTPENQIPLYIELVGGVHDQEPILGIPRQVVKPLTTYEQATKIADELVAGGINNIKLRYTGWLAGGVEHYYPNAVHLEPKLGTESNFISMIEHLYSLGIELYPDVTQLSVAKERRGDGFNANNDSAYSLNKYNTWTTLRSGGFAWVLSPAKLPQQIDDFLADYQQYNINGLSLRDLGLRINADFQERDELLIDRSEAQDIIVDQIKKLAGSHSLMVDGANVYALPYADHVLNMPITSSGFIASEKEVPFYQMVTRGFVNYSGAPLNYAIDFDDALLKSLEVGSYPYFIWTYEDSSMLKDSSFQYLLSTGYETWYDYVVELYTEVSEILLPLQGQTIVEHNQVTENVFATIYEDGTKVIVNYNREPVEVDGYMIDQKGYLVMEGE